MAAVGMLRSVFELAYTIPFLELQVNYRFHVN
jgi:hypothetical protein